MKNKIELLSPAGDLNRGKFALNYGADAIYLGAKAYSLRARASNFDFDEIKEIIKYAHLLNRKVYIVTNIICRNVHMQSFNEFINSLLSLKPDGLICADPFIINTIRKIDKNIEIHVSTQQSVTNSKAALFFKNNGCNRVILAREVSYLEVCETIKNLNNEIDVEYFIHGALCIAYSGRCMISNNFSLRDSNVGGCSQSCRWIYKLYDDHKVYTNEFSMSAKDMNQLINVPNLIRSGLTSLKIEGRMKSEYYIATVVNAYRNAIDSFYEPKNNFNISEYENNLSTVESRKTSCGWFNGQPSKNEMLYHSNKSMVNQVFAFVIYEKINENSYWIISRNNFNINQEFEIIGPNHEILKATIKSVLDEKNNLLNVVNTPMTKCKIQFNELLSLSKNDIGRIKKL